MTPKDALDLLNQLADEEEELFVARSANAAQSIGPASDLGRLLNEFEQLRDLIDHDEAQLKQRKARYQELATRLLPEAMQKAGVASAEGRGSLSLASGAKLALRTETHVSYLAEHRADLHQWLRDTNSESLIVPTVHSGTLRSHVKELVAEKGDGALPPFLKVYRETSAVLTRRKPTSHIPDGGTA